MSCRDKWECYYSSLSKKSPNTGIMYVTKLINFEIVESTKLRGNVDDPFGLNFDEFGFVSINF